MKAAFQLCGKQAGYLAQGLQEEDKGIDFRGDSMSDYRMPSGEKGAFQNHHKVYRKKGAKCPKKNCIGVVSRIKVGARSGHFCPVHQKKFI